MKVDGARAGNRLDRRQSIEAWRDSGNTLDVRNGKAAVCIRIETGANPDLSEQVLTRRCSEADMEVRSDVFDAHDVHVATVPGRETPPAVGEPEQGRGELSRVAQGKPDE